MHVYVKANLPTQEAQAGDHARLFGARQDRSRCGHSPGPQAQRPGKACSVGKNPSREGFLRASGRVVQYVHASKERTPDARCIFTGMEARSPCTDADSFICLCALAPPRRGRCGVKEGRTSCNRAQHHQAASVRRTRAGTYRSGHTYCHSAARRRVSAVRAIGAGCTRGNQPSGWF